MISRENIDTFASRREVKAAAWGGPSLGAVAGCCLAASSHVSGADQQVLARWKGVAVPAGFDLRDEAWIPVRTEWERRRVGLRELFKSAHQIEDLEVPIPPAASGLLRILAAITARVAGADGVALDDSDEAEELDSWLDLRRRVLISGRFDPEAVDEYFDRPELAGRFELFGEERPFLQDARLLAECVDGGGKPNTSGVNKLVLGRPTGVNGAVLFGHFTDAGPPPVPAAEAAWHLIAQVYYGPSGQCTPRRITNTRTGSGDSGPLRKTVSFHPWGANLFTTLVLAVPPPIDDVDLGAEDVCPWEQAELPSPLGPLPTPTWPGGILTGRARHAVLLVPSEDGAQVMDAYVTWSTHEPAPHVRDPYLIYDHPKKDGVPYARTADSLRAVWRDVDALLRTEAHRSERPAILNDLSGRIPAGLRDSLRIRAYGFDQDGQQRDAGWYEATTPPVLRWLTEADPPMALHLSRCHATAELVAEKLDYAAKLAWKLASDPKDDPSAKVKIDQKRPGPWARAATSAYWPLAERVFWSLLTPERLDERSERAFADVALKSLDDAMGTARSDVRGARAWHRARKVIQNTVPRDTTAR